MQYIYFYLFHTAKVLYLGRANEMALKRLKEPYELSPVIFLWFSNHGLSMKRNIPRKS